MDQVSAYSTFYESELPNRGATEDTVPDTAPVQNTFLEWTRPQDLQSPNGSVAAAGRELKYATTNGGQLPLMSDAGPSESTANQSQRLPNSPILYLLSSSPVHLIILMKPRRKRHPQRRGILQIHTRSIDP